MFNTSIHNYTCYSEVQNIFLMSRIWLIPHGCRHAPGYPIYLFELKWAVFCPLLDSALVHHISIHFFSISEWYVMCVSGTEAPTDTGSGCWPIPRWHRTTTHKERPHPSSCWWNWTMHLILRLPLRLPLLIQCGLNYSLIIVIRCWVYHNNFSFSIICSRNSVWCRNVLNYCSQIVCIS